MGEVMDVGSITLRMLFERPLDIPLLQWALFLIVLSFIVIMIYLQVRDDPLDMRWLILDKLHRPSIHKIGQLTALLVSTWGFVVLVMKGQLTETYFGVYMTVWTGSTALEAYLTKDARKSRRKDDREDYRAGSPDYDGRAGNPYDNERN